MEFKDVLSERSKTILAAKEQCATEEATKQFMLMPFLGLLGYNVFDPSEVVPEHHADFNDKYQNRCDYAVFRDGQPCIAIEVKGAGKALEPHRGQLKSYFNACPTVKLGILTNGSVYECFADSNAPNIMDDKPFLVFDLAELASGSLNERTLHGIESLQKVKFDPAAIGNEARRKLMLSQFISRVGQWEQVPSDGLVRLLLEEVNYNGVKTQKLIDETRDLAKQAITQWMEQSILRRMGIDAGAPRAPEASPTEAAAEMDAMAGIDTTARELEAFEYARRRLAFLVDEDRLYKEIEHVEFQDMKTTFRVFYKKPVAGAMFTLREVRGELNFKFPALGDREIISNDLAVIDQALLESFKLRVGELHAK